MDKPWDKFAIMGLNNCEFQRIENDFGITIRHHDNGFQIEGNEKKRKLIRDRLQELKEVSRRI